MDEINIYGVRGWAIHSSLNPEAAKISVVLFGEVIATGQANQSRPDVKAAGFQIDNCGFSISVTLSPLDIARGNVKVGFWRSGESFIEIPIPVAISRAPLSRNDALIADQIESGNKFEELSIILEGPIKGDYSISIVNRSFAKSLLKYNQRLSITSDDENLQSDREYNAQSWLKDIYTSTPNYAGADVHTINTWPPATHHMVSDSRTLHCYAWEESEFPPNFVRSFNRDLTLICVTSLYTKHALESSGVSVPIAVIGNGVDHMLSRQPRDVTLERTRFRFLHISSCFPRKGVDVLIKAFVEEFSEDPSVELLIKTFDNPHNADILQQMEFLQGEGANIEVINKDLSPDELYQLYTHSDCLVAPSRGEGFLLPAAEAMAIGLPVIVTDAGGQTDFCDMQTSWIVRSRAAKAQTHMGLDNSFWYEPDIADLRKQMRHVFQATAENIKAKTELARLRISQLYTWELVGNRYLVALDYSRRQKASTDVKKLRLAIVSTWNQACGISTYTEQLVSFLPSSFDITIISEDIVPVRNDEHNVLRTWSRSSEGALSICDAVARGSFDAVLIQHHPSHFAWHDLALMVEALAQIETRPPKIYCQLHSTAGQEQTILQHAVSFTRLAGMFFHTLDDIVSLPVIPQTVRTILVPHGIHIPQIKNALPRNDDVFRPPSFHIGSFGFCMPHKGVVEHVSALALLREKIPGLKATLLHAVNDDPKTLEYAVTVFKLIKSFGLQDIVDISFKFMDKEDVLKRLSGCDVIVLPYRDNAESASGAAREIIGLSVPIVTTPISTFKDIESFVHQTSGFSALELADTIFALYSSPDCGRLKLDKQKEYIEAHSWSKAASRIANVIRSDQTEFPLNHR